MRLLSPSFRFLEHGPLIDRELELVQPDIRYLQAHLTAVHHVSTMQEMPLHAQATRETFVNFIRENPRGHQAASARHDNIPAYHFWMRLNPAYHPPIEIAGGIGLRIGTNSNIDLYFGHIGYHVYPLARGHHYAERSCRLLFPLARAHGYHTIWITCNPDNIASRRTCERLGGIMTDIVTLPEDNVLYKQGDREKCRYRIEI